jgi:hypothetical protein
VEFRGALDRIEVVAALSKLAHRRDVLLASGNCHIAIGDLEQAASRGRARA